MVGDLVTHDLHDVVAIGDEAEGDGQREHRKLPEWDRRLGLRG